MKRFLYPLLILPLIGLLTSCEGFWLDCIEGNNNPVVVKRTISKFDEIEVTGPFDVYVTKADSFSLRIDAEENLIPEIETRIVGEKLYVETDEDHCLRNNLPIKVFVSTDNLKEAILTGSGLIQIDTVKNNYFNARNTGSGDIEVNYLETDRIEFDLIGSGDIEASGLVEESDIELLGSGNVRTIDLAQSDCEVNSVGSGDTYVYALKTLKVKIAGSGDVYYKGTPSIESNITGSGELRKY